MCLAEELDLGAELGDVALGEEGGLPARNLFLGNTGLRVKGGNYFEALKPDGVVSG